jgi:hypothetical protein
VQWALTVARVTTRAACDSSLVDVPPEALWRSVPEAAVGGEVALALGDLVEAAVGRGQDAQVALFTRAVDGAGNVQPAARLAWFVDLGTPTAPGFLVRPDRLTLLRGASFELKVVDASPGSVSFHYTLTTSNGSAVVTAAGDSQVVQAVPSAADPSLLTASWGVSGLAPDVQYELRVWSRDQAGHVSSAPAACSWFVVSSVPPAEVLGRPDAVSGAWLPSVTLGVGWGVAARPADSADGVSFEMLLFGDRALGAFHAPRVCNGSLATVASALLPVDCVDPGCSGERCVYRLALPHTRGDATVYTLQVRAL